MIPFAANTAATAAAKIANAFEWPGQPPHLPHSPWDFVTVPEEERATTIGSMHRKIDKDRACGSGDMLADRQTQTDVLITIAYFVTMQSRGRSKDLTIYSKVCEVIGGHITTSIPFHLKF